MINFVLYQYYPGTASTNRVLAYLKAFSELGVTARLVTFKPDPLHSKFEEPLPNIDFVYLWDKYYIDFPKLNKISLRFYLRSFINKLNKDDVVYVYGFPDMLVELSKRKDIHIIEERTEHNDVHFKGHIKNVKLDDFLEGCRKADGVIVISTGLKDYYIKNGCDPERVHIVNMIVDTTRFEGLKKQQGDNYIAYCGSATNYKDGVDQLIRAFSIVVKSYPSYKLYIIGNKPTSGQEFDNLTLVNELGIEKNVIFTGAVPAKDVPQFLMNASILALARPDNIQAEYGFPTKLGEYLSTGNPVVLTRVGDIPLFLTSYENALLVEPQNPNEFAESICWLIKNPKDAQRIGNNGKSLALTEFNYLVETKKILNIINNIF